MRDKPHDGQIDHTRDHHMINGQLVPVVEARSTRAGSSKPSTRRKAAKKGKGEVAATGTKATA